MIVFFIFLKELRGSPLLFRKSIIKPNKLPFLSHTIIRLHARIQEIRSVLFTRIRFRTGTRNCYKVS